jgi:hypothetical protein
LSPSTPVSYSNKTDRHDIAEILLKVALNAINLPKPETFPPDKLQDQHTGKKIKNEVCLQDTNDAPA